MEPNPPDREQQPAKKFIPYDPNWIIDAAKRELPSEFWLHEALSRCTQACSVSPAYTYFIDPTRPNQPGSDWQFNTNLHLRDTIEGPIVLDILKECRPGEGRSHCRKSR